MELDIDNILIGLFFEPIAEAKSAYNIIKATNPDFIARYEGLTINKSPPDEDATQKDFGYDEDDQMSMASQSDQVSISGMSRNSSAARMNKRSNMRLGTNKGTLRQMEMEHDRDEI